MNNVLIGNGLNIEIDNTHSLSNRNILYRLNQNLRKKEYSSIFESSITSDELRNILKLLASLLPKIVQGGYDQYITDQDESEALKRIRRQYTRASSEYDIGMEDYFFILRMENKSAGDREQNFFHTSTAMKWLFLDSIFNEGKSQRLAINMKKRDFFQKRKVFEQYNNLFTVNYDCNLEVLADKSVYYLHGNFNTLYDQYEKGTLQEYCERRLGNNTVAPEEWSHIYCNAIMGFCGLEKERVQQLYENFDYGIGKMKQLISRGIIRKKEDVYPFLYKVAPENRDYVVACAEGLLSDLSLYAKTYPSDVFKKIQGTLDIVGLSPNNDDHIWNAIRNNNSLEKIRFYFYSEKDRKLAEDLVNGDERWELLPVREYW